MGEKCVNSYDCMVKFANALRQNLINIYKNFDNFNINADIFNLIDANNKEKLEALLDTILNFGTNNECGFSFEMFEDLLNYGNIDIDTLNYLICKNMYSVIRMLQAEIKDVEFEEVSDVLRQFACGNYFEYKDGKLSLRNLQMPDDYKNSLLYKLASDNHSFDAVMTNDNNMYIAITYHDALFSYLISNSINLEDCIRIRDNRDVIRGGYTFSISGLAGYVDKIDKNKQIYLSKSKLEKLIDYFKTTMPHLTKRDICQIFKNSDGFGYDFLSASNENNVTIDYDLALENLSNIMAILDDYFPDDDCEDLVASFKERIFYMQHNVMDIG